MDFKRLIFFVWFFVLLPGHHIYAQAPGDSIFIIRERVYYQNNLITSRKLTQLLNQNESSRKLYNTSKAMKMSGLVFELLGAISIGYSLGAALGGGSPGVELLGVGVGCLAVGIPLSVLANSKKKRAVDIYNSALSSNP